MKKGTMRYARLAAAVAGVVWGSMHVAHAQTVTWDPSGSIPPTDGSTTWDTTTPEWYNSTSSTVAAWTNGETAVFGNPTSGVQAASGPAYSALLYANITAQNIVFGTSADSGYYSIFDGGNGSTLTLSGNLVKASAVGESIILLSNPINLTAGDHVVSVNDTPGPEPELAIDSPMQEVGGAASITVNNAAYNSGYSSYGTFVLNSANNYSGGTNIVDGIVTDNAAGALGTGTVTIGSIGCLAIGGNNTTDHQSDRYPARHVHRR